MKKKLFTVAILTFMSIASWGQISTKQNPRSFQTDIQVKNINNLNLQSPNVDALLYQDSQNDEIFKIHRCGVRIPVHQDFFDKATKISLPDANLYMLQLNIEGASALNFYSDDFYIPQGGELYIWNPDKTKCLGAFTADNNTDDGYFATDYVYNDKIILEYYQPKNVLSQAKINIECIGYFYKDIINYEQEVLVNSELTDAEQPYNLMGYGASKNCHVNVNCSEGDDFRNQQRAVAKILIIENNDDMSFCTGTLLNNTKQDRTPYLISAGHCVQSVASPSFYSRFVFYFNYEAPGCSKPETEPGYSTLLGAELLVNDTKFNKGGADYLFMKLKRNPPQSYNVYWAGWSRTEEFQTNTAVIHHPAGDIKKISTIGGSLFDLDNNDKNFTISHTTHWCGVFIQTEHGTGVTEGGSSGSGLFTRDGYLIGTLSGGNSDCSGKYKNQDWFGKFYVVYPLIKQWVNPDDQDIMQLPGLDSEVSLKDNILNSASISVYPNPATETLHVNFEKATDNSIISVLDNLGRSVYSSEIKAGQSVHDIDVTTLNKGVYYVRIYCHGDSVIKKFVVQ